MERDGGLLTGSFIDKLGRTRGEQLVVLDDVHLLGEGRDAVSWIAHLIEESGPRVRFLLTCRGDCPIPLARREFEHALGLCGGDLLPELPYASWAWRARREVRRPCDCGWVERMRGARVPDLLKPVRSAEAQSRRVGLPHRTFSPC